METAISLMIGGAERAANNILDRIDPLNGTVATMPAAASVAAARAASAASAATADALPASPRPARTRVARWWRRQPGA